MTTETGGAGARIKHVVVLMLENRSFDQMLGLLPGVNGVKLGPDGTDPAHVNYLDPQKPDPGQAYAVHKAQYFGIPEGDIPPPADMKGIATDLYGGPSHSFPSASQQLYNDAWGPAGSGAKGTTPVTGSGFVKSYAAELMQTYAAWAKDRTPTFKVPDAPPRDHVEVAMAAFTPEQLPVINGLAQAFCVCDHWFSEVPGPTEPNRLFMHAATSVGLVHNPWEFPINARTIYEDIDERAARPGAAITTTWRTPPTSRRSRPDRQDPAVRALCHRSAAPGHVSQLRLSLSALHQCDRASPTRSMRPTTCATASTGSPTSTRRCARAPSGNSTLLVITYDEHGGFYDHVFPPDRNILSPDGLTSPTAYDKPAVPLHVRPYGRPKPQYAVHFDRLGFRVPAVLVSPWLAKGHVESRRLQHTSVLATVRKMWGLRQSR